VARQARGSSNMQLLCHLSVQTDQALGVAARPARIIMDQIAKSHAPHWCRSRQKFRLRPIVGFFAQPCAN
jgi:hypothetical protein